MDNLLHCTYKSVCSRDSTKFHPLLVNYLPQTNLFILISLREMYIPTSLKVQYSIIYENSKLKLSREHDLQELYGNYQQIPVLLKYITLITHTIF